MQYGEPTKGADAIYVHNATWKKGFGGFTLGVPHRFILWQRRYGKDMIQRLHLTQPHHIMGTDLRKNESLALRSRGCDFHFWFP